MPGRSTRGRAADCTEIRELLPVYLNRSLTEDATRRVKEHLVSCTSCRQEEQDTRTAEALFEGHLPVELLLDYSLAHAMPARHRAVVESHLATCERCAKEVRLVRQEPSVIQPAPERGRWQRVDHLSREGWRVWALAASVATLVATAGWVWTWTQLVDTRQSTDQAAARANVVVAELLPATGALLRQGEPGPGALVNRVERPNVADEIVLVLLAGGRSCLAGCSVEVYDSTGGGPIATVDSLVANSDGHQTLALKGDWLPSGRSILAVVDQTSGEPTAEYLIEVRP